MFREELLQDIDSWNFEKKICENTGYICVDIYKKLQVFFQELIFDIADVARIKKMLETVMKDFKSESEQIDKVSDFLKLGAVSQSQTIIEAMHLIDRFSEKIDAIYNETHSIISLASEMEGTNKNVQISIDQLVKNQEDNFNAMQKTFNVIKSMIRKTEQIQDIIKLIDRISRESNLLGLNAKVEAVHAGSYGRGFSVVADEIQRLSRDSKEASGSISDIIRSILDEAILLEEVTEISEKAFSLQSNSVSEVRESFKINNDLIEDYIGKQRKFFHSIDEIKEEEKELVNVVSRVFSSIREVSATAQEISNINYNQNNGIRVLEKLNSDFSKDLKKIDSKLKPICILPLEKRRRRVAVVFENENPFWDPLRIEAIKAAEAYDYDIDFFAPKSRGKQGVNEMADILDEIIKNQLDGLVISPIDDILVRERLRKLNMLGTKIVFINSKLEDVEHISLIHTDGIKTGEGVAQMVMGILGNKGEVIVNSWADSQLAVVENRRIGFVEKLKKSTDVVVHEVSVPSGPTKAEAENIIKRTLSQFPEAQIVFLTNFDWGLLFADYKKRNDIDVQVIVVDYIEEVENALKEGLINNAIGQRAYSWGTMAISFIDNSFANISVPKVVDTGTFEVNEQTIKIYMGT